MNCVNVILIVLKEGIINNASVNIIPCIRYSKKFSTIIRKLKKLIIISFYKIKKEKQNTNG